jgi:hypothetical protein
MATIDLNTDSASCVPTRRTFLGQAVPLAAATAASVGAFALPAGAAVAAELPGDPLSPGPARKLLHSYRIKQGIAHRLHDKLWACESAAWEEAPELFEVPESNYGEPVTTFLHSHGFGSR